MYKLDIVDFNSSFELEKVGEKVIYNCDNEVKASDWVREEVKKLKTFDAPQLSSFNKCKQKGYSQLVADSFGYYMCLNNNVYENATGQAIFTSGMSRGHGLSIVPENILKVTSFFTARKAIQVNWINCKDEYLAPNESHESYEQFTHDSLIYSLFNNSSQQSSLRQIDYKNKKWDIKNEFFWLSKDDILNLAEENNYDELYKDAKTSDERFVYKKLFIDGVYNSLSPDAKEVLDAATILLRKSIQMRKLMSDSNHEYHLSSWDAGYAQLKLVWKSYFPEEFKSFRQLYTNFENRMRPLVYELGFLKN